MKKPLKSYFKVVRSPSVLSTVVNAIKFVNKKKKNGKT